MTFKISEATERLHVLSNELPADEVVVEDRDGELIHIDSIVYNGLTGFIHVRLGKAFDDEEEDE